MRVQLIGLAAAALLSLAFTPPLAAQGLPSDVEQRLGIPPNSANPDRRRGGYRAHPYYVEREMRRQDYRRHSRRYYDDDYYDRRRYRRHHPAYVYPPRYHY